MIELTFPGMGAEISLQTEEQKSFLADEEYRANMDGNLTYCWYKLEREGYDRTIPNPVSFRWQEEADGKELPGYYFLMLSETEDMGNPLVYMTKETFFDVYNLKVGTKYYWCVQRNGRRSAVSSFSTRMELPRCIRLEDVSNVRDMGGYKTEGGRIRQGMVYRGSEFELHMHLTPAGAEEVRRLGLRTEIDMRGEARNQVDNTTVEPLGVTRTFIPCSPYGEIFEKAERDAVRAFFKVFTSEKNYPIYYHCWGGADRTGTFAFILGAFLGMTTEDLIDEFEFTSLSIWGIRTRNHANFEGFMQLFNALPGNTNREKATAYLKKYAGLTDKQLEKMYTILVEPD